MNADSINQKERRVMLVQISPEFLMQMAIDGAEYHFRIESGLPEESKVVGACYDPRTNSFILQVESEKFSPVKEGNTIPFTDSPVFKNLADK